MITQILGFMVFVGFWLIVAKILWDDLKFIFNILFSKKPKNYISENTNNKNGL